MVNRWWRRRCGRIFRHIEFPGDFQLIHVAGIDLRQRRIAGGGRTIAETGPIGLLGASMVGEHSDCQSRRCKVYVYS